MCHTWCFITIRRCFRRSMVSRFGVTIEDYVFGASDLFPVDSIKVCEFTLLWLFFSREASPSVKNTPPAHPTSPQLCVRQVGRVWHIKILIHLRSTQESRLTYFECEHDAANVLPLLWPLTLAAFPLFYTPRCVFSAPVKVLQRQWTQSTCSTAWQVFPCNNFTGRRLDTKPQTGNERSLVVVVFMSVLVVIVL